MIHVNDKWEVLWRPGMCIQDVLAACGFTHHYVAVSVNGELVPPGGHDQHPVADGDDVRVIHIIGGG